MKVQIKRLSRAFFIAILLMANSWTSAMDVEGRVVLKTDDLIAVQKEGNFVFITSDGRFAISGQITEVWRNKQVTDIDELKYVSERIDIASLKLPYSEMNVLEFGSGEKTVNIFVDPQCSVCKRLLVDAKQHKEFRYRIFVIPALGDSSNELAVKLYCAHDRSSQLDALIRGELGGLPQKSDCDKKYYDLGLMTSHLFGIKSVPWIMAPDGRTTAGYRKNLWAWLGDDDA